MIKFMVVNNTLIISKTTEPKRTLPARLEDSDPYDSDRSYVSHQITLNYLQAESTTTGDIQVVQFNVWKKDFQGLFLGTVLKHNPNIVEIDLSNCRLRDKDIPIIITVIQQCKSLERVTFSKNFISNEGAELLIQTILSLPAIKKVDLSDNDIGPPICQFIDEQLSPTKIECDLSKNQLPDDVRIMQMNPISPKEIEDATHLLGDLAKEFEPGDLLYGLAEGMESDKGRNPVESALQKVLTPHSTHQLLIVNPLSDWVINKNNLHGAFKRDLIIFEDFLNRTQHSIYPEDDQPFIKGWSEHKILCKFGILWAKRNNHTIHYVLDDMNMEEFSSGNRNRADTSVTESEIKFIARFYDNLKDNIVFWRTDPFTKQLVKVPPPWQDPQYKQYWDGYMKSEGKKMRHFPKGKLDDKVFFSNFASRKAYSIAVYREVFETILTDIFEKSSNQHTKDFILKYQPQFAIAKNKHQIEKALFAMQKEYAENKSLLSDTNIESFLTEVVKPAMKYSEAPENRRFFFRRPMMAMVYGDKVLDKQALFRIADQITSKALEKDDTLNRGKLENM